MNISKELIKLKGVYENKNEAIREAGQLLVDAGAVAEDYIEKMIERDEDVSTYMGNFIAIPHGTSDAHNSIKQSAISIVQVPEGVFFGNNLVTVVFGIAGKDGEHLDILSKIAILCEDIANVQKIADANTAEEIISLIKGV